MRSRFLLLLLSWFAPNFSDGARIAPYDQTSSGPVQAVNLAGWLVTEGWITPKLFENIPVNWDLLDGANIQLQSVVTGNSYLCAVNGGGSRVIASQTPTSTCQTFILWRITETTFQFRTLNRQFVGLDDHGKLTATSVTSDDYVSSHTFEIVRNKDGGNLTRVRAPNGSFLQVNSDTSVSADYPEKTNWGDDDPSVFMMAIVGTHQGEYQVTNGYVPDKAASVLKDHWNSFIVEDDFKFIAENGLTAVRIPIGWWIRFDQNPPRPFVAGSLQALDNAFSWAEKYNLKVIIDLHAAPGSQNGEGHSGTRDGLLSWGQTDDTIDQTIAVIDFVASRYAKRSGLYAIELLNEPLAPEVQLDRLKKYYRAGYETVRKYSEDAFVIMSNRLEIEDPKELIQFASGFSRSVVDVHYTNYFSTNYIDFTGMSVQQNIDFVTHDRASALTSLMVSNGPLIFVGAWTDEMRVVNASKLDYQRFGSAQINVYGMATFGWSYWTLKSHINKWSLEWMIKNGYISL